MYNRRHFAKNEKELETLIQTVRIYSQDIGMEFGKEKSATLAMKSGEKETYKYLGILEAEIIKQAEMKEKKN